MISVSEWSSCDFSICQNIRTKTSRLQTKYMKIHIFFQFFFQRAVNNSFPFSSHDNRHCLQNVGEYFDFVSTQHWEKSARSLSFLSLAKIIDAQNCEKRKMQIAKKNTLFISIGMWLLWDWHMYTAAQMVIENSRRT